MCSLRIFVTCLMALFREGRLDAELDDEVRAHLDLLAAEYERRGMSNSVARAAARRQEVGLRLALGARQGRLVRQLLTESLVLSVIGGALGVGLAYLASDLLVQIMSRGDSAIVLDLSPNGQTLTFTLVISVAAGLIFIIVPALLAAHRGVMTAARVPAGTALSVGRWSQSTIAIQVALSLLLLVEAGLFARQSVGSPRRGCPAS